MKYPKILNIGDSLLRSLFIGQVNVEEKVDGSMFRVWFNSQGKMLTGSKSVSYDEEHPVDKGFYKAVESAVNHLSYHDFRDMFFVFEYLAKPKQNTLTYSRVPKDNLVLLDIMADNQFISYQQKKEIADEIGFEVVPLLFQGIINSADELQELLKTESFLGKSVIEGVVIKNYTQFHTIPYMVGMPVFGKFVRKEFKELNKIEWKVGIPIEDRIIEGFPKEARWQKAVQHLKEQGLLTGGVKDIGRILEEINRDFEEECSDMIKELLWKEYKRKIQTKMKHGFADWFKKKLLEEIWEKHE